MFAFIVMLPTTDQSFVLSIKIITTEKKPPKQQQQQH